MCAWAKAQSKATTVAMRIGLGDGINRRSHKSSISFRKLVNMVDLVVVFFDKFVMS